MGVLLRGVVVAAAGGVESHDRRQRCWKAKGGGRMKKRSTDVRNKERGAEGCNHQGVGQNGLLWRLIIDGEKKREQEERRHKTGLSGLRFKDRTEVNNPFGSLVD